MVVARLLTGGVSQEKWTGRSLTERTALLAQLRSFEPTLGERENYFCLWDTKQKRITKTEVLVLLQIAKGDDSVGRHDRPPEKKAAVTLRDMFEQRPSTETRTEVFLS